MEEEKVKELIWKARLAQKSERYQDMEAYILQTTNIEEYLFLYHTV